jgi:hypothetical protein
MRWRSGSAANLNAGIGGRAISALLMATILSLVFWQWPNLDPAMLGATAPEHLMALFTGVFLAFWSYLVVQGYPVSHGDIGTASTHNFDNILSGLPAIPALFGIFLHVAGFWPLSSFNLLLSAMTLAAVLYDLWVIGGAAAKINRLTDEIKPER